MPPCPPRGGLLADLFHVPKRRVPAEVFLPGQPPIAVDLFLSEFAQTHDGAERPSDLLSGSEDFFPAAGPDGKVVFFQRNAVMFLSVPARHEIRDGSADSAMLSSEEAAHHEVRVFLEDGTDLQGTVSYVMPEGQRRLQDYLNRGPRFLIVRDGETVRLVNRARIVRISML